MKTRFLLVAVTGCLVCGPLAAQALPTPPVQAVPVQPGQGMPFQVVPVPVNPAAEQEIAMLRMRVAALERRLALLETTLGRTAPQAKADPNAPHYVVGQIIVVGNEHTPTEFVLRQLGFDAGRTVTEDDLRRAEQRLTQTGLFEVNPQTGMRPTISIMSAANPKAPVDILVHVHDR